ncbi:Response regulator (modular protein) [Magnetospirillum sp. LM-5]|uniref:bacteriohemerythrin n=1 Tax=Magnetospirillum sp. LM-5 TaxID=2681466 RepID=UPI00137EC946|nr:bacteriohemerythrin [Magnetospirillum sp. LM-5]CAA7624589.1 Response regulator (modular protein) [Magnetospirillum sp. LM-5]
MTEACQIAGWSDAFSVGNAAIDSDHKAFFEIANLLKGIIFEAAESKFVIESALAMLEEYVAGHFLREEKAMEKIGFQHFEDHRAKHFAFNRKINEVIRLYRGGSLSVAEKLHDLVLKWLASHIMNEDMKFRSLLTDDDVDQRPLAYLALDALENEGPGTEKLAVPTVIVPAKLKLDYSKITALICEPSSTIRSGIRFTLNEIGISNIEESNNFIAIDESCRNGGFQIIVMDAMVGGNDSAYFIRQIRSIQTNCDPFVLTVLLLSSRDEAAVRSAMSSGTDSVLLIPFSSGQLRDQIIGHAERRKPFIVTQDYIGPERQNENRPGCASAPQIIVPNPVEALGRGISIEQYEYRKNEAIQVIVNYRLKSLAGAIVFECNSLAAGMRDGVSTTESTFRSLTRLENIADELAEKIRKFSGAKSYSVETFRDRCRELKGRLGEIAYVDIEELSASGRKVSEIYASR